MQNGHGLVDCFLLGRFCGRKIPTDKVIENNHIQIVFTSNTRSREIALHWSAVSGRF